MDDRLSDLKQKLANFNSERDWDQFHSPKNLSMALSVEASEVVELFQWMTEDESKSLNEAKLSQLADEIGDVFLYLLLLSEKFGIDPIQAAHAKLQLNREKYPAGKAKGSAKKYDEL